MRIYNFFHEYSMQELDLALNELSASEYRDLEEIFDDHGVNMLKYHEDRSLGKLSVYLKFLQIIEKNRRNGIISMNELTTKIMDMVNSGKCNKEICEELDIDYKTLYYELKKVKYFKRNYNKNSLENIVFSNSESEVRFLVISDLHFGNSLENIEVINRAFNYAKSRGINVILCCGDFIDGTFSRGKKIVELYFKQFEHFALNYPYDKDIVTFGVGGNHDYSIKLKNDFDFIKFCKMYRDDVVVKSYADSILNLGEDTILLHHDIEGFQKVNKLSKIVLNGHRHIYSANYINNKKSLNIYVPTLSNLVQVVPETLELDLNIENDIIVNANVKEICFGNRDIILSEKDYSFSGDEMVNKVKEQPKIKELEKRSSQIDKFNKRYSL